MLHVFAFFCNIVVFTHDTCTAVSLYRNRTDAAKGATSGDACIAGQASNKIIRKPSRSPSHQKHDSGAKGEAPALACVKGGALVGGTGVLSGVSQAFSSSSSLHSQIAPASGGDEGTIRVAISVEDIDAVSSVRVSVHVCCVWLCSVWVMPCFYDCLSNVLCDWMRYTFPMIAGQ